MMDEDFYDELREKVKKGFEGGDGSHDFGHVSRVYNNALLLSQDEPVDFDVVRISALLHDIARPLEESKNICHAEEGAKMAIEILGEMGVPQDKILKIASAIATHRYSKHLKPESKEAEILQDADRLDALGAITIARIFTYGGKKNRLLYGPNFLSKKVSGEKNTYSSLNHFYDKIFKLKPEGFHTAKAREIAKGRYDFVKQFVDRFEKELEGKL